MLAWRRATCSTSWWRPRPSPSWRKSFLIDGEESPMLAVIIGGGRGGSYLARDLQTQGYRIKVVDRRPEVVARLRQEIGGDVICGDGCSPQILDQVGLSKADLVVALTHNDEDNLVVCRLAKHHFHVPRVIAR